LSSGEFNLLKPLAPPTSAPGTEVEGVTFCTPGMACNWLIRASTLPALLLSRSIVCCRTRVCRISSPRALNQRGRERCLEGIVRFRYARRSLLRPIFAAMIISLLVAASTNNVIGKEGKLLWHLPNDMKFFKNTTWGMPVVMGRKTYESLAGEPLPGRFNFVITRSRDWDPHNEKAKVVAGLTEAIDAAAETDCRETFVIGGGQIYAEAMAIADRIYMTRVDAVLEGDTWFPAISEKDWEMISHLDFSPDEKHAYAYSFQVWERRK
jgi:dihydrofolate reductase